MASTAPINVEGDNQPKHSKAVPSNQLSADQQEKSLHQIADLLFHKINSHEQPETSGLELVISINGFSNSVQATKARAEEIYHYINNDSSQQMQNKANNLMYIGYRWPSEPLVGDNSWWLEKVYNALAALPLLPRVILFFGVISIALSIIFDWQFFVTNAFLSFLFSLLVIILTTMFFFVVSLIILRSAIYFRDYYRATNYGVPDLVELVRQLDKALVNHVKKQHLDKVSLVYKFKILVLKRIRTKLSLEGKIAAKQEELILEIACEKMISDYFLNQEINSINIEDLSSHINDSTAYNQEYLDHIVNLGREIINRTTDKEFVKIKDRAKEILDNKAKKYWQEYNRIKLSFIGHSMGAYVVTSAVRILSDVFDLNSVGTLGLTNKIPTSDIGSVFALERLLLVAPDIPITTILSGRANILRSSLRRFREAYLFSNEGDLALRIASTVANYFSFPARTRESGYRLGNVAIKDSEGYGIINLNHVQQQQHQDLLKTLFVDSFNLKKSLANIQEGFHFEEVFEREEIASLFTYFDCTDYTDKTTKFNSKKHRILTIAKWRWEPRWIYYIRLSIA
ncbi:MAG: alpha/beta hydrolase, partial [Coleofasciculaceae cyanobacterium]